MAQLQSFVDPTGQMSQEEINAKNISALIQENNKTSDQLGNNQQLSLFNDGNSNRYEVGYQTDGWGTGKNVGIKASKPGIEVTTATDLQLTYKDDFTTKTWYDNTNPRILEGLLPDGSYGMWVSKPGFDVTTATTTQLIFNSNQDVFKVVQSGTVTIPGTGNQAPFATGATGITVPHNFGYAPAFTAFVFVPVVPVSGQPPVSSWNQAFPTITTDSNGMTYNLQCGTDATNIYFVDFWSNGGNTTPVQAFSVAYYLYTTSA